MMIVLDVQQPAMLRQAALSQGAVQYREFGPARAPPILFIHGVLANHHLWQQVAARLATQYRCIVPTWPLGAHSLPMNRDADLSPDGMVALIAEFMDALHLDRATLVGNNSGGALCQMMVAAYPRRVERLVLTSCDAYNIWLPLLFKYLEFSARVPGMLWLLGQTMRLHFMRPLPIAFGWLAKRLPRHMSDDMAGPLPRSSGVRRDVGKFLRGISPRLTQKAALSFGSFTAPVLIAWSREDRFFPQAHAVRLKNDFPNARLLFIDDAYTFSGIDNPGQLALAIQDFLTATT
ncbi:MAG: alpha/beta hydrolase [Hyphomonadaceae bacterium]|nr:alpha/beta hydrolase [Hyphomonadaceae bacterium]